MSVEIEFPIEVMVPGVPLSQQASTRSKEEWKERIRTAARKELPEGYFAAEGPMKVTIYYFSGAPAGVVRPNTGHHHLLIDVPTPPLDAAIPADLNHIHLGNGQTERKITLPPGEHTLQLILGDDQHVPHDPPIMSERITIYVGAPTRRRVRR